MSKTQGKTKIEGEANWYDLWMKQSREFFESADKNLKDLFTKDAQVNPEDHIKQINFWLESLKSQWQFNQLNEQQKAYEDYGKMMSKMCMEALDMMVKQWIQRTKEQNPIKNIRELYELWLNCCNEIYANAMHSKTYQEACGELLNAAIHFWKSSIPKSS